MNREKFVKYLMEKAERIFLQSREQKDKATFAELNGEQLANEAVAHNKLSKSELVRADKSEELALTFEANARLQHDQAETNRDKSEASEKMAIDRSAKSDTQFQRAGIFRENAIDLQVSGDQLEAKAVEIETELQKEKWSNTK